MASRSPVSIARMKRSASMFVSFAVVMAQCLGGTAARSSAGGFAGQTVLYDGHDRGHRQGPAPPPRKGPPAGHADVAETGLDSREGAGLQGIRRDEIHRPRAQAS